MSERCTSIFDVDGDELIVTEWAGRPYVASLSGTMVDLNRAQALELIGSLQAAVDAHDAAEAERKLPKVGDLVLVSDAPRSRTKGTVATALHGTVARVRVAPDSDGDAWVVSVSGSRPGLEQGIHIEHLTVIGRALDAEEAGR